jgi:hypothetical protein
MGIKNYLTSEEKQELQQQLKFHEHPNVRERIRLFRLDYAGEQAKKPQTLT